MNAYTYIDNSNYPVVKVVFKCQASDILEADKKYEQEIGTCPVKQKGIAVLFRKRK